MVDAKMQKLYWRISVCRWFASQYSHRRREEDIDPEPALKSATACHQRMQNLLLVVQLLLRRQPIRRQYNQRDGIRPAEDASDIMHRLEELEFGDDVRVRTWDRGQERRVAAVSRDVPCRADSLIKPGNMRLGGTLPSAMYRP
jgi:hypothetical protein